MKLSINGTEIEVSDEDLTTAIEKKEGLTVKNEDFVFQTTEKNNTYIENLKKEQITIGSEIGRKELFKELDVDFEGTGAHKSAKKSVEFLTNWSKGLSDEAVKNAGVEPDKKVMELNKDLETLQSTIKTITSERDNSKTEFATFKKDSKIKNTLSELIPDNTILPKADILTLMKGKINVDINESGVMFGVGTDGQPIKDSSLTVLPIKDIVNTFFNDNAHFLKPSSGGANGVDSGGTGGKQSIESFTKEMQEAGKEVNGTAFNAELQNRMKAGLLEV